MRDAETPGRVQEGVGAYAFPAEGLKGLFLLLGWIRMMYGKGVIRIV